MTDSSASRDPDSTVISAAHLRRLFHDMRAPVRHIRFFLNVMNEELVQTKLIEQLSSDTKDSIGVMERAGETLDAMLDQFRLFAMASQGELTGPSVLLSEIIESVWEELSLEHGVDENCLSLDVPSSLLGAELAWKHLVWNLIDNAIRNKHESRDLRIRIAAESSDGKSISRFVVRDAGVGFADKSFQNAIQPFERIRPTHPPRPGMGLAIVKILADQLGMSLSADVSDADWTQIELNRS